MNNISKNDPPKGFDQVVLAAFAAGVAHGTGLAAPHPRECCGDAYRRWRDRWAGRPHEGPGDATKNAWYDREPQPGDGPEYHAEHNAWEERQKPDLSRIDRLPLDERIRNGL